MLQRVNTSAVATGPYVCVTYLPGKCKDCRAVRECPVGSEASAACGR